MTVLKDADEDEILDGGETVLMTDKYPNREPTILCELQSASKAGRPESATSTMKESCVSSPEPILRGQRRTFRPPSQSYDA